MALAARELGAPAVVVMPTTAPPIKIEGAKAFGAEVILEGTTSVDRLRRAQQEAQARGLTMVPPFDHEWIIAGQGTVALEMIEDAPMLDTLVVPIGGGGLASGMAVAAKGLNPSLEIVGVQAELYPSMYAKLRGLKLPCDGDSLAEVHRSVTGARGNAHQPVAVTEVLIGEPGLLGAEHDRGGLSGQVFPEQPAPVFEPPQRMTQIAVGHRRGPDYQRTIGHRVGERGELFRVA